jgi:capsular exopolysaccharide synthesis family protein
MALKDFWHTLRRWLWLILLVGAVGGAGAYLLNPTRYQSRVLLAVGDYLRTPTPDRNAILSGIQLAETYAVIATTPDVLRPATEASGVRVENVARQIETTVIPDTGILSIEVTHHDPAMAVALANAIATELMARGPALQVVEWAQLPARTASPTRTEAVVVGSLLGMALVVVGAYLYSYLDDSVRDAGEASQILALPVVGAISELRQRGALADPARVNGDTRTREQFRTLRTNLLRAGGGDGQLFLITSALPGEGKSTVAAHLAVSLAEADRRVVLIDGDLRCPVLHTLFDLPNDRGLIELLKRNPPKPDRWAELNDPALVTAAQQTAMPNLRVITSGGTSAEASKLIGSRQMEGWVQALLASKEVDAVLIDTPPALPICDALDLATRLDASILLVIQAGKTARDALVTLKDRCEYLGLRLGGLIMNRVQDRANAALDGYYSRYAPPALEPAADPNGAGTTGAPPTTLLVALHDEALVEEIAAHLPSEIYEVRTLGEGEAAFAAALEWRPQLIVMDVELPDTDGVELCRRLKATPATEQIPVVLVAASGAYEDVEEGFAAGGVDYLVKPFDPRELVLRIETHLRQDLVPALPEGR